jgi:hypothetical protein
MLRLSPLIIIQIQVFAIAFQHLKGPPFMILSIMILAPKLFLHR